MRQSYSPTVAASDSAASRLLILTAASERGRRSHTYTTLERPNLHFSPAGKLTHINLAADLITGDEGWWRRPFILSSALRPRQAFRSAVLPKHSGVLDSEVAGVVELPANLLLA